MDHLVSTEPTMDSELANDLARLSELATLRAGWLDGHGASLRPSAVVQARELLIALHAAQVRLPRIYPTPEGTVSFEWDYSTHSVNVELQGLAAYLTVDMLDPQAAYSWLGVFDANDIAEFFSELQSAIRLADESSDTAVIFSCLDAWQRTAAALADPVRRAVLLGDTDDDFVDANAPS